MVKLNIQLFAEGEGESAPAQTTPTPATPAEPSKPAAEPQGKTFSADYVHDLREESKGYRQTAKSYEAALRKVLNVADGEDIGDVEKRIKTMQAANEKAVTDAVNVANSRLIAAEIKSLEGYDHKLLAKVMDYSGVTVDENGEVKGIKEAAEAAAKEYPAVIIDTKPAKYSAGTGNSPVGGEKYGKEVAAFRRAAGLKSN